MDDMFEARHAIEQERKRQILSEGYTSEHDDAHVQNELLKAAVVYMWHGTPAAGPINEDGRPHGWPWDKEYWKPGSRERNLVKAGALCLAEIDRRRRRGYSTKPAELKYELAVRELDRALNPPPTIEELKAQREKEQQK